MDAFKLTLSQASRLIRRKELSPLELLKSLLERIDAYEPRLKAWVAIDRKNATAAAHRCSEEAQRGELRGPLHGIPIGVKDIFYTKGMKTTAGSKLLSNFIPEFDATVVSRLREAGAIILGKTQTTEFAVHDPAPTRNPWNTKHTPGGSSSGSAAAVSSGMCPAALGSQTGGSTIRPAAYCGIIGLKPTYGRLSRYGILPVSWSLDHVGVLTRTVEDAAFLLETLAGQDPMDPTTSNLTVPSYRTTLDNLTIPRLGTLNEFFWDHSSEEVRENIEKAGRRLADSGAELTEVKLPRSFQAVHAAHRIVMTTEGAAYHEEKFQTRKEDYRPKLRAMIAAGLLTPASAYIRSQRIRNLFIREIASSLKDHDCFLTPATPTSAPEGLESTGDPAFNAPWSFCGFPAITIPTGLTKEGLPLGIQLVGHPFDEQGLLKTAHWCEKVLAPKNEPHDPD